MSTLLYIIVAYTYFVTLISLRDLRLELVLSPIIADSYYKRVLNDKHDTATII